VTCINCLCYGYRSIPIVMLPKEFARTVIKMTKRGIKSIPAFPDRLFKKSRSRQTSKGEKWGREGRFRFSLPISPHSSSPPSSDSSPISRNGRRENGGAEPSGAIQIHLRMATRLGAAPPKKS